MGLFSIPQPTRTFSEKIALEIAMKQHQENPSLETRYCPHCGALLTKTEEYRKVDDDLGGVGYERMYVCSHNQFKICTYVWWDSYGNAYSSDKFREDLDTMDQQEFGSYNSCLSALNSNAAQADIEIRHNGLPNWKNFPEWFKTKNLKPVFEISYAGDRFGNVIKHPGYKLTFFAKMRPDSDTYSIIKQTPWTTWSFLMSQNKFNKKKLKQVITKYGKDTEHYSAAVKRFFREPMNPDKVYQFEYKIRKLFNPRLYTFYKKLGPRKCL